MVQKTIIDILHKEGKSQKVITERGGCSRVLYQSTLNAKLIARKKLGRFADRDINVLDHDITVLGWPANMPYLNPIWNL